MLTKNIKVTEDMDNEVLEKLHDKQFYISKEEKPYEKTIKASDDMEIDVKPKNPSNWNFDIDIKSMTNVHSDDLIGRLKNYDSYRENIKVKDFDIDINYFNRVKEDTSFQKDIIGLPKIPNDFHAKGGAEEWVENDSNLAGNSGVYNMGYDTTTKTKTLYNGVAGVQEIDTVMKLGMAHPMGPLQLADFIGLDVCLSILNVMYDGFKNPKYAPCPLLVNMVMAGKLGVKSGEGFYDYAESKKAEKVLNQVADTNQQQNGVQEEK